MAMDDINVLLIEDEQLDLQLLVRTVPWERLGFRVAGTATGARDALLFLETHFNIDALICDVQMPIVDGLQLYEQVKRLYPHMRAVFISGYDEFRYAQSALRLGASGYVLKPIDLDELVSVLTELRHAVNEERNTVVLPPPVKQGEVNNRVIEQVCAYINVYAGGPLDIEALASVFHYSASHLAALFKQHTGVTLGSYLTRAHFKWAADMLCGSDDDIARIAETLGYTSVSHFISRFKRIYRMTPGEYRRRSRMNRPLQ